MKNQLPQVGDLAQVVRVCGCRNSIQYLGLIIRVDRVYLPTGFVACSECFAIESPA